MNKAADVVFVLLGAVSILGAVLLLYGIGIFESQLNEVLGQTESIPLDPASVQQVAAQAKGVLAFGKLWTAVVIISSLGLIYFAVSDMRKQRSIVTRKK